MVKKVYLTLPFKARIELFILKRKLWKIDLVYHGKVGAMKIWLKDLKELFFPPKGKFGALFG